MLPALQRPIAWEHIKRPGNRLTYNRAILSQANLIVERHSWNPLKAEKRAVSSID
jgi:hypothetical protein